MNTLNERIKIIRKDLGLSQKELSEKIGISQRAVSWGEQPGNNVPDNTIKALCMAFNINESWLRNGTEPMYLQPSSISLDQFVKDCGGTDLELEVVKAYFNLPKDVREAVMQQFQTVFTSKPSIDEKSERDQLHAELDRQLDMEKEAKEKFEVS